MADLFYINSQQVLGTRGSFFVPTKAPVDPKTWTNKISIDGGWTQWFGLKNNRSFFIQHTLMNFSLLSETPTTVAQWTILKMSANTSFIFFFPSLKQIKNLGWHFFICSSKNERFRFSKILKIPQKISKGQVFWRRSRKNKFSILASCPKLHSFFKVWCQNLLEDNKSHPKVGHSSKSKQTKVALDDSPAIILGLPRQAVHGAYDIAASNFLTQVISLTGWHSYFNKIGTAWRR